VYELNMLDINSLFTFGVYFPSIFIDEINVRKWTVDFFFFSQGILKDKTKQLKPNEGYSD